jgi:HEPN domain-containing protein
MKLPDAPIIEKVRQWLAYDAEELSPYAITARYPGEDLVVSEAGARRAVEIAERVQEIIRNAFRQEGFEAGPENKPA